MNVLSIDTESNTWNKGSWSDRRHKAVCYSWADDESSGAERISPDAIERLQRRIDEAGTVVGFNIKYDAGVLRKLGIKLEGVKLWDCQIAEFILSKQTRRYPSLEESLIKYELGNKIDIVKLEYWDKGIQTEDIPWEILSDYAEVDAIKTLELYKKQMEIMTPQQIRLCNLQCIDLLILAEMEWNGLKYNEELCERRAEEIKNKILEITTRLSAIYPDIPINFNSGDHLSAFLYGGTITEMGKEHIGFFKSGERVGQPKYKNIEIKHELPRLVEPVRGSELKKEGFFATNADTLLKLRASRKTKGIIELIQQQVRLDTLLSKTYNGIRKANVDNNWEPGWLHGQFNQVVAQTGRLSSSGPNLQNFDGKALDLFISRYDE